MPAAHQPSPVPLTVDHVAQICSERGVKFTALDIVTIDACRRFHVDNLTARMLCTYRGAGAQITQPGQESAPLDLLTGEAAILRGALWPGREAARLLHRSSPVAGTGKARLLLVIDPGGDYRPQGNLH